LENVLALHESVSARSGFGHRNSHEAAQQSFLGRSAESCLSVHRRQNSIGTIPTKTIDRVGCCIHTKAKCDGQNGIEKFRRRTFHSARIGSAI